MASERGAGVILPRFTSCCHMQTLMHTSAAPRPPPFTTILKPSLTCMQPVCSTCSTNTLLGEEVGLKNKITLTKIYIFRPNFLTSKVHTHALSRQCMPWYTHKHPSASICGLEEWSQCAARQPADEGRAGTLQGHVCLCVCVSVCACVRTRGAQGLEMWAAV